MAKISVKNIQKNSTKIVLKLRDKFDNHKWVQQCENGGDNVSTYATVTLFARFLGLSGFIFFLTEI